MPRYRLFGETIDLAAMMNIMGEGRAKKEKVNESRLAKYLKGVTWGGGEDDHYQIVFKRCIFGQ